ncbi:hypothetical protein D1B31_18440 [Neobacillus notoginsengisoli]|uniref:Uncharacterized protein n=1 Tax=Neobacillus notoginsengisoli TaxID=1578198 RepID=A0A417YQ12_9BACI|nr:hypothetical protein [Neobacillus notoginsengisoli]RHW36058.1 hypothetical protein D1B31_18440 [Neobacillus notoginsengisoli]
MIIENRYIEEKKEVLKLKKLGFNIRTVENDEDDNNSINLEGVAEDEIDLISQSIQTLIKQLELCDICGGDQERFENEMKKIITAVLYNYQNAGLSNNFHKTNNSILSNS